MTGLACQEFPYVARTETGNPSSASPFTVEGMAEKMSEGERLAALLEAHGKTQADLARAAGRSPQAVSDYVKAEQFKAGMWETVRAGLENLGISPAELRPSAVMMREKVPQQPLRDLRPYIKSFSDDQLRSLLQILDADEASRDRLVYAIEAMLQRIPR